MAYTCPPCKCFQVVGPSYSPPVGLYHLYNYASCNDLTTPIKQYESSLQILPNQVDWVCAIENTFSGDVIVNECTQPSCDCTNESTCIPQAFCYTITLVSGTTATFQYIVPDDGVNTNMYQSATVTTGDPDITVCAYTGTIVQTFGSGTISISAPGGSCSQTGDCFL